MKWFWCDKILWYDFDMIRYYDMILLWYDIIQIKLLFKYHDFCDQHIPRPVVWDSWISPEKDNS